MVIFIETLPLVGSNNPLCLNFSDHCIQFFFIQNHLGWLMKDAGVEIEAVILKCSIS